MSVRNEMNKLGSNNWEVGIRNLIHRSYELLHHYNILSWIVMHIIGKRRKIENSLLTTFYACIKLADSTAFYAGGGI